MGNHCTSVVVNKVIDNEQQNDIQIIQQNVNKAIDSYILKYFNKCVQNRELYNAMAIMDEYCTSIDFSKYYFKHGDTSIHYAVRLHKVYFLYYLLQKGYNVCLHGYMVIICICACIVYCFVYCFVYTYILRLMLKIH